MIYIYTIDTQQYRQTITHKDYNLNKLLVCTKFRVTSTNVQTIIHNSKHTTYLVKLQFEELLLDASIHVKRFSLFMYR